MNVAIRRVQGWQVNFKSLVFKNVLHVYFKLDQPSLDDEHDAEIHQEEEEVQELSNKGKYLEGDLAKFFSLIEILSS